MDTGSPPRLTDKQAAVLERVDRRVPIKLIAADLDVSESRINQHIRKLKDAYGVVSLNDLVAAYREQHPDNSAKQPCRKPASTKSQLPKSDPDPHFGQRNDPGELVFSDAMTFPGNFSGAPWDTGGETDTEPQVVPGVLDGNKAVIYRLAAMIGIAFGLVAAVMLVVATSVSLTEAFDGKARIPVEEQTPAG